MYTISVRPRVALYITIYVIHDCAKRTAGTTQRHKVIEISFRRVPLYDLRCGRTVIHTARSLLARI